MSKERMPYERAARTHRFVIGGQTVYLSIGEYEDGRLGEIFIRLDKEGSTLRGIYDCYAIAVSMGLQHGVPLSDLFDKFSYQDFEPNGITDQEAIPMAKSIIDYVFQWLYLRYDENGKKRKIKGVKKHE